MNDNPHCYLEHEQRPDSIARRHEWRIYAHNQQARVRSALLRERRFARYLVSAREDLRLTANALQREIERTTRLEDDLARARAVNEQAEKVRDENDRMRRAICGVLSAAIRSPGDRARMVPMTALDALAATVRP